MRRRAFRSLTDLFSFLLTHLMRGATMGNPMQMLMQRIFLLTHLMRGATWPPRISPDQYPISTHAPHARCDRNFMVIKNNEINFYSRTSCEVRLTRTESKRDIWNFYSRTSCEVRQQRPVLYFDHYHFYSRTSCEVRHLPRFSNPDRWQFLLTHLMRGATGILW